MLQAYDLDHDTKMRKLLTKGASSSKVGGMKEEVVGFFVAKSKDTRGMLSAFSSYKNTGKDSHVHYLMEINPESQSLDIKLSRELTQPFSSLGVMINQHFEINHDLKENSLNTILSG